MLVRVLLVVGLVLGWSAGCGSSHHTVNAPTVSTDADAGEGSSHACIDMDGDGYGEYCPAGADCNDNDPTVTDQCRVCTQPALNCPCDPGTKPMKCDPHYAMKVQGGTLVCSEGTRYCRDGYYSDCEVLAQYVMFVSD